MPKLLSLVPKDHPLLRDTMPQVQDFKNPELIQNIEDMCYSIEPEQLMAAGAAFESAAGMAANQWGLEQRVFIVTPRGGETEAMQVMINPSYKPCATPGDFANSKPKFIAHFEGCFSIPLTLTLVNRYESILATYYDCNGNKIEKQLTGYKARVFQHEADHLDGKLCDGVLDGHKGPECFERIIFESREALDLFQQQGIRPFQSTPA